MFCESAVYVSTDFVYYINNHPIFLFPRSSKNFLRPFLPSRYHLLAPVVLRSLGIVTTDGSSAVSGAGHQTQEILSQDQICQSGML